jgi:hypothetical protein
MLQTGQVLFHSLSVNFALVLPFKDSSEAAEPFCSTPRPQRFAQRCARAQRDQSAGYPRRSEAPPR